MKNEIVKISANAKINLLLDVKRRRGDGYHKLEGIMQEISIADDITLSPEDGIVSMKVDRKCCSTLKGLNELYRGTALERSREALSELGLKVGADVPFCLTGGCAIARGVGERLTPINGLRLPLLIVRGPRGVSTGRLFSSLGVGGAEQSRIHEAALENALCAIERSDAGALARELENALQPAE